MKQKIERFSEKGISASVMTTPSKNASYKELYQKTGGAYADLSGNMRTEISSLAGHMADEVNDGCWVMLSNYQSVKLDGPVSASNKIDTDGDGLSDYEELGALERRDLSAFQMTQDRKAPWFTPRFQTRLPPTPTTTESTTRPIRNRWTIRSLVRLQQARRPLPSIIPWITAGSLPITKPTASR